MNYKEEIWKPIKGFEGLYEVSNFGRIKSLKIKTEKNRHNQEKILKQCKNRNGYFILNLSNKSYMVHRLVALNFIENPNNFKCVNHINGIKTDNRIENLEWCSSSHNNKEAYRLGLKKPTVKRGKEYIKKPQEFNTNYKSRNFKNYGKG